MKNLTKAVLAGVAAASVMAVAGAASAAIVCNTSDNVCWHVHRHYVYAPSYGVVVHPNNWTWGANDHYVWKEHAGRGYWHNGVWVTF